MRGSRVVQVDRRAQRSATTRGVREKFGVEPALIPDLLALVGDSADGYPGIRGIGRRRRGAPPEPATGRSRSSRREALAENRELALLFKDLATLRADAPHSSPTSMSCAGAGRPRDSRRGRAARTTRASPLAARPSPRARPTDTACGVDSGRASRPGPCAYRRGARRRRSRGARGRRMRRRVACRREAAARREPAGRPLGRPARAARDRPARRRADRRARPHDGRGRDALVAPTGRDTAAAIPVERIAGPILTASGGADRVWTWAASMAAIAARRRAHGVGSHDAAYLYPAAGRLVDAALPSTFLRPLAGGSRRRRRPRRSRARPALARDPRVPAGPAGGCLTRAEAGAPALTLHGSRRHPRGSAMRADW